MRRELLMVFVKNPITGKVKTRLAATVGNEAAFAVYQNLLEYTLQITSPVKTKKIVFYSDFIPESDTWRKSGFQQELQTGLELGERMMNAFHYAFENKYSKVVLIGCDCLEINTDLLNHAFEKLNEFYLVIGPATDGGYYLLGINRLHGDFFRNKIWGSASVYRDTIQDTHRLELSTFNLPVLNDIDEEKDLTYSLRLLTKSVTL